MNWDGKERRGGTRDHDVLTRIDANLSNFMKRFEDHASDDTRNFKALDDKTASLEERTRIIEKRFWVAYGVAITLFGIARYVFR